MYLSLVRRPIGMAFIALAVTALGLLAEQQLPRTLTPQIELPVLTVRCDAPGFGAAEVEERLLGNLERELATLPGLAGMEGRCTAGAAEVVLWLRSEVDVQDTVDRLRDRLGSVPRVNGAEAPRILRYDPAAEPVLRFALRPLPGAASDEAAIAMRARDELTGVLESLAQVAAVRLRGERTYELHVVGDDDRLRDAGLSRQDLEDALRDQVTSNSAGRVSSPEGMQTLRIRGAATTPERLAGVPIRGRGVRVGDVTKSITLELSEADELAGALLDGTAAKPALIVEVLAVGDAGLIATVDQVFTALPSVGLQRQDADGQRWLWRVGTDGTADAELVLLSDRSVAVRAALDEVTAAVASGAVLALVVLVVFLPSLLSAVIIFVCVPLCVVATFLGMSWWGVSLNLMSLGGLALGVGMLVDNAIVVLEVATRLLTTRTQAVGRPLTLAERRRAVAEATTEVGPALVASTLTTIAVFVPLSFVPGYVGHLLADQAFTVSASIIISLVVALSVVPALAAVPPVPAAANDDTMGRTLRWRLVAGLAIATAYFAFTSGLWGAGPLEPGNILLGGLSLLGTLLGLVLPSRTPMAIAEGVLGIYRRTLRALVAHPWGGVGLLVGFTALGLATAPLLGVALLPETRATRVSVQVELPRTSQVTDTLDWSLRMLDALSQQQPGITGMAVAGENPRFAASLLRRDDHQAEVLLILPQPFPSAQAETAFLTHLEQTALDRGALAATARIPPLISLGLGGDADLDLVLHGDDSELLRRSALDLATAARAAGARGVSTSASRLSDELVVTPNPALVVAAGLTLSDVKTALERAGRTTSIEGWRPRYAADGSASLLPLPIRIDGPLRDQPAEKVGELQIGPVGKQVRLYQIATITQQAGDGVIIHRDSHRVTTLSAESVPGKPSAFTAALLREVQLPPQVLVEARGSDLAASAGLDALLGLLGVGIFLVLVVMAVQFESVSQPVLVMIAVPTALAGALAALALCGFGIDAMSGLGLVLLAGVAVNNAIVLVSTVNLRREAGMTITDAAMQASEERLRPILMTTLTTLVGLVPLAMGWGSAAELRAPLAVAVMGGLACSTVLVLLALPSVLVLVARKAKADSPP